MFASDLTMMFEHLAHRPSSSSSSPQPPGTRVTSIAAGYARHQPIDVARTTRVDKAAGAVGCQPFGGVLAGAVGSSQLDGQ
jgi:hypothetical protein